MTGGVQSSAPISLLGQSGCRLQFPGCTVYLDPYLSHSVQEMDSSDLVRQVPIPIPPEQVVDADWVLITHDHIDHCDPHTLPQLAGASPLSRFMGPSPVLRALAGWGIAERRLHAAEEDWVELARGLRVHSVPAAHPEIERDEDGGLVCVGYVLEHEGRRIYIAGDTSVRQTLLDALSALTPIDTALLPVNERNFFRDRRGIVGNMTVREAFQLAEELGIKNVVPVHWDMFAANAVSSDEIRAIYRDMAPSFSLLMRPEQI